MFIDLSIDQRIAVTQIAVGYMASLPLIHDEQDFLDNLKKYSDLIDKHINPKQGENKD